MSTDSELHSKTLSPAKQPEINPWLRRKLQKNTSSAASNSGSVVSAVTVDNKSEKSSKDILGNLELLDTSALKTVRIKPTAKDKWVHYDATIIVDTKTSKTNKGKNSNNGGGKKRNNRKKTNGQDHQDSRGKTNVDSKSEQKNNRSEAAQEAEPSSDLSRDIKNLALEDKENEGVRKGSSASESATAVSEDQATVTQTTIAPESSRSPLTTTTNTAPHSKTKKMQHRNSARNDHRKSQSHNMAIPLQPVHPLFLTMPNYMFQLPPLPPQYVHSPVQYPMMNYFNGRLNERNYMVDAESSSSSINHPGSISSSPSPSPSRLANRAKASPEPFYPQQPQYPQFYPIPASDQAVYQMMPPIPPSPHNPMLSPYMMDPSLQLAPGAGFYTGPHTDKNGRQSRSKSRENFSRSSSTVEQLEFDVAAQLDYYFSKENLIRDSYLRSNMKDGYVELKFIATFLRFKALTGGDLKLAVNSLPKCNNIEYKLENDEYYLKSKFDYIFKKK